MITWTDSYPADYAQRGRGFFVAISDGTNTVCAKRGRHTLRAMVKNYAGSYGFNEPGDVTLIVTSYKANGEEMERLQYIIRSIDGRTGQLFG